MPEAMRKIPTFQEALIDSRRSGKKIGEQEGTRNTLRQTLIRQLRRKFDRLPDLMVLRIQTTEDIEQLKNWLDQIISVNSLAEAKQVFQTDEKAF
jgi:hypothetical protein